jgi:PPOX class probable F420-dependent enzyme
MNRAEAWERLGGTSVATLATLTPDGAPHLVPVVFAIDGGDIVTAIDSKPKAARLPRRVANIIGDSRVCLLAHHYEHDWSRLWWVRVDGRAAVEHTGFEAAVAALQARYPQYRQTAIVGPVIRITVVRVTGWAS